MKVAGALVGWSFGQGMSALWYWALFGMSPQVGMAHVLTVVTLLCLSPLAVLTEP